jgi:hypothetical protein
MTESQWILQLFTCSRANLNRPIPLTCDLVAFQLYLQYRANPSNAQKANKLGRQQSKRRPLYRELRNWYSDTPSRMTSTQIDHIVLLVSTPFFEDPPAWLTTNFTITPGGYHNGQTSRNKLIIFADGTYLELFNWYDTPRPLDDENLPMRFWGPKEEGLIDFALTSTTVPAEECINTVNKRLAQEPDKDAGLGVSFQEPIAGSRKRTDGKEVKWKVTRPIFRMERRHRIIISSPVEDSMFLSFVMT